GAGQGQLLEGCGQVHRGQGSQVAAVEHAVAGAHVSVRHTQWVAVKEVAVADRAPDLRELRDRFEVGLGCQRDRIEGARATADQAVRLDAGLEQRLQYAHAAGPAAAPAPQDKDQPALFLPRLRKRWSAPSPPGGQHGRGPPEASFSHRYYV